MRRYFSSLFLFRDINMTRRTVKEWIGKTADSKPPPTVRLRILKTHDGHCRLSGIKIRPGDAWDCDHVKPLWDGGENREVAPVAA